MSFTFRLYNAQYPLDRLVRWATVLSWTWRWRQTARHGFELRIGDICTLFYWNTFFSVCLFDVLYNYEIIAEYFQTLSLQIIWQPWVSLKISLVRLSASVLGDGLKFSISVLFGFRNRHGGVREQTSKFVTYLDHSSLFDACCQSRPHSWPGSMFLF